MKNDNLVNGFHDPLLSCLITLTKIHKRAMSKEALTAGLPLVNNKLKPQHFIEAAKRAHLNCQIVERPLMKISKLVLPAVAQLKNDQACIIKSAIDDENFEVIMSESEGSITISKADLEEEYTGFAIFIQPEPIFEDRAEDFHVSKPKSWFWGTIWRFKSNYYRVALAALLINFFGIASPLFVMNVYDRVVPNDAIDTLWVLAIGITIAYVFDFTLRTLRGYLIDVSGKKADILLSTMLFQQVLHLRMEGKPASAGSFANNLHGYEAVRDFFTSATLASLIDLPFILMFVWVIWMIGGPLAIIPLLAIPVVILVAIFLEAPIRRAVEQSYVGAAQKQAILVESINSLETIKSLRAEGQMLSKWEKYIGIVANAGLKSRFFSSLAVNFSTYVMQMITVLLVIYGVYIIKTGNLTMGGLIACVILSGRTLAPLTQVASLITRYQQSKMGLDSLNQVMDLPLERDINSKFLHCPTLKGDVEFRNITFNYPNQEVPALSNISFKIEPSEKVAIIGRIGSGKSTVQKLNLGLYQPTEGAIYLNGIDLRQIDPANVRSNIGYVSQDCNLFYGTLRENLVAAKPWATDEEVLEAAQLAGVTAFSNKHPAGLQMPIGEHGQGLSGGQRQSIAIARTFLQDPQILLLDEPTSSLDHTSESIFISNIKEYMKEKTVILVTHKSSMLPLVDRIIVVDNGKIVIDDKRQVVLDMLSNKQPQNTAVGANK